MVLLLLHGFITPFSLILLAENGGGMSVVVGDRGWWWWAAFGRRKMQKWRIKTVRLGRFKAPPVELWLSSMGCCFLGGFWWLLLGSWGDSRRRHGGGEGKVVGRLF